MGNQSGAKGPIKVPFASVEDAIARRGEERGIQFYDDLVATHSGSSATDLAKSVLRSLGVEESAQKVNGIRTRYGNDVQAIAFRIREARKRAGRPRGVSESMDNLDRARAWANDVEAMMRRDPAYKAALLQVLRQGGYLNSA